MEFRELLEIAGSLPLFRSSFLMAGDRDPRHVQRQLSRWARAGKVVQLRRNVYTLASPWRRVEPHPFLIANDLESPSYVSLQSALAHYGLIPEAVPVTTSITTGRPADIETPLGHYLYRHVAPPFFFGYLRVPLVQGQEALIADPEKALLDLAYLTPGGESMEHLESLRLEGLDRVDPERLRSLALRWNRPKIHRAAANILRLREGHA